MKQTNLISHDLRIGLNCMQILYMRNRFVLTSEIVPLLCESEHTINKALSVLVKAGLAETATRQGYKVLMQSVKNTSLLAFCELYGAGLVDHILYGPQYASERLHRRLAKCLNISLERILNRSQRTWGPGAKELF